MGRPWKGRKCCAVMRVARSVGGTEFSAAIVNIEAREGCMVAQEMCGCRGRTSPVAQGPNGPLFHVFFSHGVDVRQLDGRSRI